MVMLVEHLLLSLLTSLGHFYVVKNSENNSKKYENKDKDTSDGYF